MLYGPATTVDAFACDSVQQGKGHGSAARHRLAILAHLQQTARVPLPLARVACAPHRHKPTAVIVSHGGALNAQWASGPDGMESGCVAVIPRPPLFPPAHCSIHTLPSPFWGKEPLAKPAMSSHAIRVRFNGASVSTSFCSNLQTVQRVRNTLACRRTLVHHQRSTATPHQ